MAHVIERRSEANTAESAENAWVRVQACHPDLTALLGLPIRPPSMPAAPRDPIIAFRHNDDLMPARGIGVAVGLSLAIWSVIAISLYLLV